MPMCPDQVRSKSKRCRQKRFPCCPSQSASTREKKERVCIAVDDYFREKYVRAIIRLAEKCDANLTFSPKGETILKNAQLWRDTCERGNKMAYINELYGEEPNLVALIETYDH